MISRLAEQKMRMTTKVVRPGADEDECIARTSLQAADLDAKFSEEKAAAQELSEKIKEAASWSRSRDALEDGYGHPCAWKGRRRSG